MEHVPIRLPTRQRRFLYAEDDTWEKLTEAAQEESLGLLIQMLRTAIVHELPNRSNDHERKDST